MCPMCQIITTATQLDRDDFKSLIMHVHLEKLRSEAFSAGRSAERPVCILSVVIKAGSDCWKLILKTAEGDQKEEATASLYIMAF